MTQKIIEPIILKADYPTEKESMKYIHKGEYMRLKDINLPEGLQAKEFKSKYYFQDELKTDYHELYIYPELGKPQTYDKMDIVVNFGGINYILTISVHNVEDGDYPGSATVMFSPTNKPVTEGTPVDVEKGIQEAIDCTKESIKMNKSYTGYKKDKRIMSQIYDLENRLKELESGFYFPHPQRDIVLFGQPDFIQNPIFPIYNGRSAGHLITLNTGWGDSGNINIMLALTKKGKPAKAWFEASCF